MLRSVLSPALVLVVAAGCGQRDVTPRVPAPPNQGPRPDEMPQLLNNEMPFRYPPALYARKVQGNVTLRLFIDRDGRVQPDSTRLDETSGYPLLDSAALAGAGDLRFVPAKLHGEPMSISILFPIRFRHPEAAPLPGDSAPAPRARSAGGS
jgi:TonB family protein